MNLTHLNNPRGQFVNSKSRTARQRRQWIMLGAGCACIGLALVVFFMLNYRTEANASATAKANMNAQNRVGGIATVMLLVPETTVAAGAQLSEIKLKAVYWPRAQVPTGAIREHTEVSQLWATEKLPAGLPISRDKLSQEKPVTSLPISKGMRAVSLRGDATQLLEGHARPGSRVDVVLTYMKEGERTSKVLVENARVLSLGGQTGSPSSAAGAGFGLEAMVPSASTITIEVRPQDALEIQTAKQMGQIGLILRSSTDTQGMDKTEINEGDVSGNKSRGPGRSSRGDCIRGYIKSGGQNLMLGCDGSISAVLNSDEP